MPATARELQQFLDSLEPGIARAFRESVAGIRNSTRIGAVEEALRVGNVNAAIDNVLEAVALRPASWSRLTEAVRTAYRDSGQFTMESELPSRLRLDFNMENPRTRDWLAAHSSELVTEINRGQRGAIRAIVTDGFQRGDNPRRVALDIVGRVSSQTGRRAGGVIGLHEQFAQYASNMRGDLNNLSSEYFTRTRRDRRFDGMVRRAIESGQPLNRSDIDRLVGRYEDRLLQTRGTNIARTEALSSMSRASDDAMDQVIDEGLIDAEGITDIWDASMDGVARPDHADANGQRRQHGEPFEVGGYLMMRPGDTSLGAPVGMIANCRCVKRRSIRFERVRE